MGLCAFIILGTPKPINNTSTVIKIGAPEGIVTIPRGTLRDESRASVHAPISAGSLLLSKVIAHGHDKVERI